MARLSKDDVLKLARLARLELSEEEVSEYFTELNAILEYVEQLQGEDTSDLKPTNQVTGLINVTREDKTIDYGYPVLDLLKNVPFKEQDQIKVRRMVG